MTLAIGVPLDRHGYVEFSYDDRGRSSDARTYDKRGTGRVLITHNRYTYDDRGDIKRDYQEYRQEINSGIIPTPYTAYDWDFLASASNPAQSPGQIGYLRPTGMTYPAHPDVTAQTRSLTFAFGLAGSADWMFSRTTAIATAITGQPSANVAQFAYAGVNRREIISFGTSAISQSLRAGSEVGLARLDSHGRIADLRYVNAGGTTLFQAYYRYDISGNRQTGELTQAPVGGQPQANRRSQLNKYDRLDRLAGTEVGQLAYDGPIDPLTGLPAPRIVTGTSQRRDAWQLDALGNWVGVVGGGAGQAGIPASAGRWTSGDLDGLGHTAMTQAVNKRNEITALTMSAGAVSSGVSPRYDQAGNLIFDGEYFYQYDAWNRVVQINRAPRTTSAGNRELHQCAFH